MPQNLNRWLHSQLFLTTCGVDGNKRQHGISRSKNLSGENILFKWDPADPEIIHQCSSQKPDPQTAEHPGANHLRN